MLHPLSPMLFLNNTYSASCIMHYLVVFGIFYDVSISDYVALFVDWLMNWEGIAGVVVI